MEEKEEEAGNVVIACTWSAFFSGEVGASTGGEELEEEGA
jgi:hypothetical protein